MIRVLTPWMQTVVIVAIVISAADGQSMNCDPLDNPANGKIENNSTSHNTTVTFVCNDCYALAANSSELTCNNGSWNGATSPTCEELACDPLLTPSNGTKNSNDTVCNSTVAFSCDICYELTGDSQLTCLPNKTWSGEEPNCTVKRCNDTLEAPQNGAKNQTNSDCNSTVSFTCDSCFHLVGNTEVTCQPDQNWSGDEPICIRGYVDGNNEDNSTTAPPVIILTTTTSSDPVFLFENATLLSVFGFGPKEWTIIEITAPIPAGISQFAERVALDFDVAVNNLRMTNEERSALFGTHSFTEESTGGLIQRITGKSANLEHLLLAIVYRVNEYPPAGTRHIELLVKCSAGSTSDVVVNITIRFVGLNANPPVVNINDANAEFVEGTTGPVDITNNSLVVTDSDSDFYLIQSAVVRLVSNARGSFATIKLEASVTSSGVKPMYNDTTGTLTFTGAASEAAYTKVLNGVRYRNSADDVGGLEEKFHEVEFSVFDGEHTSEVATVIIQLININDAPVLSIDVGDQNKSYSEGDPALLVAPSIDIGDTDNEQLVGASVELKGAVDGDHITLNSSQGITAEQPVRSGDVMNLTLRGNASVDAYKATLASVKYENIRSRPAAFSASIKSVTFQVHDRENASNMVKVQINFTPVNDPPIIQFREGANPNVFAPEANRTATVEYIEESDPVQLIPDTTTILDVDSGNLSLVQLNVSGLLDDEAEKILWNNTLASELGFVVNNSSDKKTIVIYINFTKLLEKFLDYLLKFLKSFKYENTETAEPTKGNRTAVFTVFDDDDAASDPATVYIIVKRRNDHPDIDLGVGINKGDNLTFVEIGQDASVSGIHISNHPHRIRIIDEEDTRNYIAGVAVRLSVANCPSALVGSSEYIYFLGSYDPQIIKIVQETDGRGVTATTINNPSTEAEIQAAKEQLENFLQSLRYINLDDEPILYCPDKPDIHVERYIEVSVNDSGTPQGTVTVYSKLDIESVNDVTPVMTVSVDGNCLIDTVGEDDYVATIYTMDEEMRQRRETVPQKSMAKRDAPDVVSVQAFGYTGNHFQAGSTVSVKFSHNTNTPTVLRSVDMTKIVQLHPLVLNELSHIGIWTDHKTLLIIFPAVNEDQSIDASQLSVEFVLHAELYNSTDIDVCEFSVCHQGGMSYGVEGRYDVMPKQEEGPAPVAGEEVSSSHGAVWQNNVGDVEQTQLHDWGLLALAFTCFAVAFVVVLVAGLKGKKRLAVAAEEK